MTEEGNSEWRGDIAFFGKIAAGFSHEINNVISGVSELSGLLTDLCALAERGSPPDLARLKKNCETISAQAQRGVTIIRQFNRFAHSADEPSVVYDPFVHIQNLVELCRRFADMKRVKLGLSSPEERCNIKGSPFQLLHLVFSVINTALCTVEENGAVTLSMTKKEGGLNITANISPVSAEEGLISNKNLLDDLASGLEGRSFIDYCKTDMTASVTISLPDSILYIPEV